MSVAPTLAAAKPNQLRAILNNRYITLIFRLILAGIFLASSFGKLVNIEEYSVNAIYNFQILPMWLARPFGLVMPFIELLCALGLLFGVLTRLSGWGVSLMSLSFFIAKAIVLSQGRVIDCGCFGAIVETLASVTIYMDIPMLLMGLFVAFSTSRHWLAIGGMSPFSNWQKKLNSIW